MNESDRYYELLGVAPGTNGHELKEAYRDLAKVWHPDRFSHDPRLQLKAQEKLKEINEAYDRLTSGKVGRPTRPAPAPPEPRAPAAAAAVVRKRPRLVLPTALVFCAAFVAAVISVVPPQERPAPDRTPPAEREEARPLDKGQEPEAGTRAAAVQPARGKERAGRQPPAEVTSGAEATSGGERGPGPGTPQLRPMPTVTVTIDALNGRLATRDCPNVSTLTYPAGDEPRQYCTVQHKTKIVPQAEPSRPDGSRLKSIGKRLAAPFGR